MQGDQLRRAEPSGQKPPQTRKARERPQPDESPQLGLPAGSRVKNPPRGTGLAAAIPREAAGPGGSTAPAPQREHVASARREPVTPRAFPSWRPSASHVLTGSFLFNAGLSLHGKPHACKTGRPSRAWPSTGTPRPCGNERRMTPASFALTVVNPRPARIPASGRALNRDAQKRVASAESLSDSVNTGKRARSRCRKPVFTRRARQLKAVLWMLGSRAQETKLSFTREADNKNRHVTKKPGEQAHRNTSATELDDGNSCWGKGPRHRLQQAQMAQAGPNRRQESEIGHSCPLGARAVVPHTLPGEPSAPRGSHERFLHGRRPSRAPQADVASGFDPRPGLLSSVSTLLFQQILFPPLVLGLRHQPERTALANPTAAPWKASAEGDLPARPAALSLSQGSSTLSPSIAFFTDLPRATRKEFRAHIRSYLRLPLPAPTPAKYQTSKCLPSGLYSKATGSTTDSSLDRHWPGQLLGLLQSQS